MKRDANGVVLLGNFAQSKYISKFYGVHHVGLVANNLILVPKSIKKVNTEHIPYFVHKTLKYLNDNSFKKTINY